MEKTTTALDVSFEFPKCIVIGGCCGSGKTTVSRGLADMLGYAFLDSDDFHTDESKMKMSRGQPLSGIVTFIQF